MIGVVGGQKFDECCSAVTASSAQRGGVSCSFAVGLARGAAVLRRGDREGGTRTNFSV
jgi:hypothetical protein